MENTPVQAGGKGPALSVSKAFTWTAIVVFLVVMLVLGRTVQAQGQDRWQQLAIPQYSNATEYRVEFDDDEYELKFRSQDDVKTVFDFYRSHLESKGFTVTRNKTKRNGLEADMVREGGGPDNSLELDVKEKNGRFEVEIEFDD